MSIHAYSDGMDIEALARLLQNLIRIGSVIDVRHRPPARVRVATGGNQTDWLPWLELRAGTTKTWSPPTKGEQVVLLSPGGDLAAAVVLAGLNSDSNPQPSESADEDLTVYPDGAQVRYNHSSGAMDITGIKTLLVNAADSITMNTEKITLDAPETTSTGKHTIEGLLSYLSGMAGENGEGGATSISGSITHTGGDLTSNGVVLHLHIHGGVLPGGAQTEGPQ